MPTDFDVILVALLLAVVGAGLLRVGLMNLKSEPPEDARKGRLYIALGIAFGIAAALILVLRAMKIGG
jgi:hypothetical protein